MPLLLVPTLNFVFFHMADRQQPRAGPRRPAGPAKHTHTKKRAYFAIKKFELQATTITAPRIVLACRRRVTSSIFLVLCRRQWHLWTTATLMQCLADVAQLHFFAFFPSKLAGRPQGNRTAFFNQKRRRRQDELFFIAAQWTRGASQ